MGSLVKIEMSKSGKGKIVPLGTPIETKTPETQIASPAVKQPTMSELENQLRQAQVDMDTEAMIRIGDQMKQMRAQTGQQTLSDRIGNVLSGTANTSAGQYVNAAGTLVAGVDYNDRQIKKFQEALKNGYTSDGKLLTDAQRKSMEESIARMQKENAEVINDPNHAGNKLQQVADRLSQTGSQQIQEAKAGLGQGGQFAVDLGVGALQLAGDIGANMIVPGAGIAAMGVRSFGGAAQEARQEGATRDQQLLYGAGSAAASLLTEKIANLADPFKKAFGSGVLDKAIGKIAAKPAGKFLMSALSEGGEEMLESAVQPLLQRLTYDPEAAYDEEWLTETLYSGALGAVLGGVGGGVDVIANPETDPVDVEWQRTLATIAPEKQIAFSNAKKVADRFGTKLNVGAIENGAAGEYLDGQITIDPNSTDPVKQVLVHELTHHMETSGLYGEFSKMILDHINTDMQVDLIALREELKKDYAAAGKELTGDMVNREVVAKFAEDYLFQDEKTIERLLLKDRNLFQKIYDWIRDAVKKMRGTEEEKFLIEAQNLYEKALKKAGTQKGAGVAQNTFGGINARTADLRALQTAQSMEANGQDADTIRQETGWFRGMDGKWRFEIDDYGMQYFRGGDAAFRQNHPEYQEYRDLGLRQLYDLGTERWTDADQQRMDALREIWGNEPGRLSQRVSGGSARLRDIIQHGALFEAYPELQYARVEFAPLGEARGEYNRSTNTITLNESIKNAPENTIVHEVQHAIQKAEGFAGGSNPDYWAGKLLMDEPVRSVGVQNAEEKLRRFESDPANADVIRYSRMLDAAETDEEYDALIVAVESLGLYDKLSEYTDLVWNAEAQQSKANNQVPSELYRNTAGEIEAREAAYRRSFTPEQRRAQMPELGNENTVFAEGSETGNEIVVLPDGKKYVKADRQVIFGNDPEQWAEQVENYINKKIRNGEDVVLTADNGDVLLLTKDTAGKASFRNYVTQKDGTRRRLTDEEYLAKLDAEAHIDEIAKISQRSGKNAVDEGGYHADFAKNGWNYRTAYFRDFDGKYYQVLVSIAKNDAGETVYNVGRMQERSFPRFNGSSANSSARIGEASFNERVSQTERAVKDPYDIIPNLAEMAGLTTKRLEPIQYDERWAYQPDGETDLSDMVKNPIPFVGVGKDKELAELFEDHTKQVRYMSNTDVPVDGLQTLQPFVLRSGIENYQKWDDSERPYIVEFEGGRYVIDGNHRVAQAKLNGEKTVKADVSVRVNKEKDPYDIIPKLADMVSQNSVGRGFRELARAQEKSEVSTDIIPNLAKEAGFDVNLARATLTAKEREYLTRAENSMTRRIGKALSVPTVVQREDLKPIVQQISDAYLMEGKVDQSVVDELFETAYANGIVIETEYYDKYKGLKEELRTQRITIGENDRAEITNYNDFRKSAMGTLLIVKDGMPVSKVYEELSERYPNTFPENIKKPSEQLKKLFEVGRGIQKVEKKLKDYYGAYAEDIKAYEKHDFEDAVNQTLSELNLVRRHAKEIASKRAIQMATPAQVEAAYAKIRNARRKADRAMEKELLTDADKAQLNRALKGEIEIESIDRRKYNVKGIRNVYEAKLEYEGLSRVVKEYRKEHTKKLRDEADADLATSMSWKDKKVGLAYSRETMERNIRDIVPDRAVADQIIRKYFEPVHTKNAEAIRAKNDYRNRVKNLKLNRSVEHGNAVSEAYAVQFLGEAEDNIRILEESTDKNPKRDGKTLEEWKAAVNELWKKNLKLNREKIANAVTEFRSIYDELFRQMNEVRVRNGYEPVAYRQGYFPHFQPGETGLLAAFTNALGINGDVTSLPTSINGLTHTFRPGITWFGNAQQRKGFETAYDAVQGFDKYIEGAADVIYQTDNIQRLRALASQMRYRTTNEEIQKKVDEIRARTDLSEDEKNALIDREYKEGQFVLNNLVVELEEYTNLLANKKSRADRNMEQAIGRRGYNLVKALESRVAANMVAINPSSWLTNFIPLTQAMATLDTGSLLKGMANTIKSYAENDGMVDASTFLTNRRGSDPLVKTWAQSTSAVLSKPMEFIDSFTADTLVRGRYEQNLKRGLSAAEALREADSWAASVMADRSKGSTPTLFNRSNPLTKAFTRFQLEVNNQMSYVFKDVPDELKKKGTAALAAGLIKMFVGAWLFNEVYEHFVGRRPAMDPLNILNEFTGDLTGYEALDLLDAQGKLYKETEKEGLGAAGKNLAENVMEQLPFMSGLNLVGINVDSGRIPATNAIPDVGNLWDAMTNTEWAPEKRRQEAWKEVQKPLTYLVSPFGGGMVKKWMQTVKAVKQGGSYTVNAKGEDLLQYPVYTDDPTDLVGNTVRGILFGKSSLPTAQEWVQSGFDSFNTEETAAYQNAVDAGVSQREAYELLRSMGSVQKTDEESAATLKRKILQESAISGEGKAAVFYSALANDKEQSLMEKTSDRDTANMAKCLMEIKDADLLTGGKSSGAKMRAVLNSGMSAAGKESVYLSLRPAKEDELEEVTGAGVSIDTWLQFEMETAGLASDEATTKKEKVVAVIDGMNITAEQKNALYLTMYSEKTLEDTPWYMDPYDLVGNIMRVKVPELKVPELKVPTLR